jgi:hypothetical protein
MCGERDQLWREYDAALRRYIEAVKAFINAAGRYDTGNDVAELRYQIDDIRARIREHCLEHGCEPLLLATDLLRRAPS